MIKLWLSSLSREACKLSKAPRLISIHTKQFIAKKMSERHVFSTQAFLGTRLSVGYCCDRVMNRLAHVLTVLRPQAIRSTGQFSQNQKAVLLRSTIRPTSTFQSLAAKYLRPQTMPEYGWNGFPRWT